MLYTSKSSNLIYGIVIMSTVKQKGNFLNNSNRVNLNQEMKNIYVRHYTLDPSRVSDSWSEISEPVSARMFARLPTTLHESLIKSLVKGNASTRQRRFSRA